jgi:hypothetical protein
MVHDFCNGVIHVTNIALKVICRKHDFLSLNVIEIAMIKLITFSDLFFGAVKIGFADKG